jgi:hypothetical protein
MLLITLVQGCYAIGAEFIYDIISGAQKHRQIYPQTDSFMQRN